MGKLIDSDKLTARLKNLHLLAMSGYGAEEVVGKILDEMLEGVVRCKDCRWGREVCGNIECSVDSNIPSEYHGYEWFCPNGERRDDG